MMKYLFGLIVLLAWFPAHVAAQGCEQLIWSDEFNYTGTPDQQKWSFETGAGGWGNNELQYYTDRLSNAEVKDGNLVITARKESYQGSDYTSARLITYDTGGYWTYGRIEARMKLPYGQGIWPAFWMLGKSFFEGTSWPACGELDIMEMIGGGDNDNTVYGTAHWYNNGNADYGLSYTNPDKLANAFHVYAIEWDSQSIKWYFDDNLYCTLDITPASLSAFHNPFFIILNIAVGGNWPGNPDATTVFPQTMEVDYVRVYSGTPPNPTVTGPSTATADDTVQFSTQNIPNATYTWTIPADATIVSGDGTNSISVQWGNTSGDVSVSVTTSCGTYDSNKLNVAVVKLPPSDPWYVPHTVGGNVNWQVVQTNNNTISLSMAGEDLEVDYDVQNPSASPAIYYPFDGIYDLTTSSTAVLELKTEAGNAPSNMRFELVDVNGNVNTADLLKIDSPNDDGAYHIHAHIFGQNPDNIFKLDQIKGMRLYFNYGVLGTVGAGKFWLKPVELTSEDITTGITDLKSHRLTLFPNPVKDILSVQLPQESYGASILSIHDMNGRLLRRFNTESLGRPLQLNLSDFASGVYFLSIQVGDKRFAGQFIKR
ncbi:family 16 glycosylhydrolase [Prolixibacter denitrificans]|uniref:Putative secreted protein (Por secretion system target) n=1 Tax=Prolixibacter denitrificans TaxID=1541063 RepID=A0A2P8C9J2_9BACT|nr:family 16 glycosylhydrolase [Prolixibacter denitrificans]PSK81632.1 putative secreted protein (Por secretion system target) [Prolixibacter denitrificans]GET21158.1 hypothetical protein JCM18694_14040 [Prolixibacter denitrificans]